MRGMSKDHTLLLMYPLRCCLIQIPIELQLLREFQGYWCLQKAKVSIQKGIRNLSSL